MLDAHVAGDGCVRDEFRRLKGDVKGGVGAILEYRYRRVLSCSSVEDNGSQVDDLLMPLANGL